MSQDQEINLWTHIESLIDKICTFQEISTPLYTTVYAEIYNYLTEIRPIKSSKIPDRVRHFREIEALKGGDVYHHIKFCLQDKIEFIVQGVKDMAGEDVLRLYANYWSQYKSMCAVLDGSCSYVNRHWVTHEYDSGRRNVMEIDPMSRQIWKRVFFEPLIPRVLDICCNMIQSQRNDQTIDISLLKSIIEILNSDDFNETIRRTTGNNVTSVDLYKESFEASFLKDAEDFYRCHIISYDASDSLITYLNQVNQCINEEVERVKFYLLESTKLLLIKRVEGVLIHDYQHVISREINTLLDNNKQSELANLFTLISQMPNTKIILIEVLKNHMQQMGINAIKDVYTSALKESKVYVDTILKVYGECSTFINQTFDNDAQLITALRHACQYFINNNSLTESVDNKNKSSELLVQYCDTILRTSKTIDDIEFEEKRDQIMFIFDFIEDKDIFEKDYGKMLAKRLINQLSVSDDREKLFVTKLKQICGVEYTSKLERMIQDIDTSRIIDKEYQNRQEKMTIDFSIMILSSNSWSFSCPPSIILPNELNILFDNFLEFYRQRHNGRKLTHLYQYSKGELKAYFTPKTYTLQVSMYQMIVLLLFNQSSQWTVEQIFHETQMKMNLLIQILNSLIESKLLLCIQIDHEDLQENDLHKKYTIQLATDYQNEKLRINLNQPMKFPKEKDPKNFHRTIDDDRKLIIQAIIVRIMKEHKILKHSLLIQKVIEQIKSRFKPQIPIIKQCIDILIEKDYLQRQSNEKDVLEYKP